MKLGLERDAFRTTIYKKDKKLLFHTIKKTSPILLLAVTIGVGFSSNESYAAQKLNDAEIKKAISGKAFTYSGRTSGNLTYTSSRFKGTDKKGGKFTGTWEAKGNKYCYKNSFGNQGCDTVRDKGNGAIKFGGRTFKPQ